MKQFLRAGTLCAVCTTGLMGQDSGLDIQNVLANGLVERGISLVLSQAGRAAGKRLFKKNFNIKKTSDVGDRTAPFGGVH